MAVAAAVGAGVSCVISTSAFTISTALPSIAWPPASAVDSVSGQSSSSITMRRFLLGICCIEVLTAACACEPAMCVYVAPSLGSLELDAAACK